ALDASMPLLFLSYRADDAQDAAERLGDSLRGFLGQSALFRASTDIPPGANWEKRLQSEIVGCAVMLVVIGSRWLHAKFRSGARRGQLRLTAEDDWVRREIELALEHGITVVPVLLENATMPLQEDLPPTIARLV